MQNFELPALPRVSQKVLLGLNIFHGLCGLIIIIVAGVANSTHHVTDLGVLGGLIACGVFLLLISAFGYVGAKKSVRKLIFLYIVALSVLFIVQFSISVAALSKSSGSLAKSGWCDIDDAFKNDLQDAFNCYGFADTNPVNSVPCMNPG